MLELSGVTCSGKSTKMHTLSNKLGVCVLKKHYWHFFLGFYWLLVTCNYKKINFIVSKVVSSDARLLVRAKVFYNVVMKFYYLNSSKNLIVDEGFIQIPFLLMLPKCSIAEFFKLFNKEIGKLNFYWSVCSESELTNRILKRGHHRFVGKDRCYINEFIKNKPYKLYFR